MLTDLVYHTACWRRRTGNVERDIRLLLWPCSSLGLLGAMVYHMGGCIEVKILVSVQTEYLKRNNAYVISFEKRCFKNINYVCG